MLLQQIIGDLFQIIILTLFFYLILRLLRGTPGLLMLGVVVVAIPTMNILAYLLELNVLEWLLSRMLTIMPIFLLIVFQSEIRRLLTFLGRHRFRIFKRLASEKKKQTQLTMIDELVDCVCSFTVHPHWVWSKVERSSKGKVKKVFYNTGALMAIEAAPRLNEYIERGIPIDAKVSSLLLQTIFFKGTPLHDGGVIIRNGMIAAAACQFPSATILDGRPIHTRHNAAIGLSEQVPDAIVIVVSEESGNISVTTRQGHLEVMESPRQFRKFLCRRLGIREERQSVSEPVKNRTVTWVLDKILSHVREDDAEQPRKNNPRAGN
ncbi:MAG: diadenylate cyclase [Lentisphaeria bacterium]